MSLERDKDRSIINFFRMMLSEVCQNAISKYEIGPSALLFVEKIREAFRQENIQIKNFL